MRDEFLRVMLLCKPTLGRPTWLAAADNTAATDKIGRKAHLAHMQVRSRRKRLRERLS